MPLDTLTFWGSNYYNHPPLSAEMVAEAERILGVKLPESLIALLYIQNGGYTAGFAHPMAHPTTWSKDHVPLDDLAGIVLGSEHETPQNLLQSAYMIEEWGLPEKQVLLSGDGHYWITLDYRQAPEPAVAWLDVECGEDFLVARNFDEFLDGLVPATTYDEA
jgi:hypothetical protein